jgi:hypothetical protein
MTVVKKSLRAELLSNASVMTDSIMNATPFIVLFLMANISVVQNTGVVA